MITQHIFLDTSFLIASQQKTHFFYEKTKSLLAEFYKNNKILVAHTLVFDEFWYVFMGLHKDYSSSKMNKLLVESTNKVFEFPNFKMIKTPFLKEDLLDTLGFIYKYNLRPRDGLIINIMKKEGIKKIASFDTDFDKIPGITRIFE